MNTPPRFCQFCGNGSLIECSEETGFNCEHCGRWTYLNSKPSVCAIATRDNHVLLIRDHDTLPHYWDVPGGFLLYGETPEAGLLRELKEELNVSATVDDFLTILIDAYGPHAEYSLNIFYKVTLHSDKISPGNEVRELKWFGLDRLPPLRFESTLKVLSNLEGYLRNR